ncbi:FAD-dependent oxidoreductase, partial [Desulfobacula sp.]
MRVIRGCESIDAIDADKGKSCENYILTGGCSNCCKIKELCPMKYIKETSKKTPVMAKTDVLVVGSGPSGLAAAIASAREGVDTMLVERYGCFGGNITQAM